MVQVHAHFIAVLAVVVMLPEFCTSFTSLITAPALHSGGIFKSNGICRFPLRRVGLRMSSEEDDAPGGAGQANAKEDLLKKLAATDLPKGPPPKATRKSPFPEWIYFALPFIGAATAYAIQYFTKSPLPVG
jgi:hypothetical protein